MKLEKGLPLHGAANNFRLNKFLDLSSGSMRKGCDGKNLMEKNGKTMQKMGLSWAKLGSSWYWDSFKLICIILIIKKCLWLD